MLDIKAIRQHPDKFQHDLARKGVSSSRIVELLEVDEQRRRLQQELDQVRSEQNEVSKQIPHLSGAEKEGVLLRMKSVADHKKQLEKDLENAERAFEEIMVVLPNPPVDDAPDGKSDEENIVIRTEGENQILILFREITLISQKFLICWIQSDPRRFLDHDFIISKTKLPKTA
ncbi:MAG: hypothetical protein HC820_07975 [Hydrococcus sp. RM1_1_31]|nr:hypothetical protein [Hydrococcus sp. RM1_1_31]